MRGDERGEEEEREGGREGWREGWRGGEAKGEAGEGSNQCYGKHWNKTFEGKKGRGEAQ